MVFDETFSKNKIFKEKESIPVESKSIDIIEQREPNPSNYIYCLESSDPVSFCGELTTIKTMIKENDLCKKNSRDSYCYIIDKQTNSMQNYYLCYNCENNSNEKKLVATDRFVSPTFIIESLNFGLDEVLEKKLWIKLRENNCIPVKNTTAGDYASQRPSFTYSYFLNCFISPDIAKKISDEIDGVEYRAHQYKEIFQLVTDIPEQLIKKK